MVDRTITDGAALRFQRVAVPSFDHDIG